MDDIEREQIILQLQQLSLEHQDLDDIIRRRTKEPQQDQLYIQRLKKRKLAIKDEIARLKNSLTPDIIA